MKANLEKDDKRRKVEDILNMLNKNSISKKYCRTKDVKKTTEYISQYLDIPDEVLRKIVKEESELEMIMKRFLYIVIGIILGSITVYTDSDFLTSIIYIFTLSWFLFLPVIFIYMIMRHNRINRIILAEWVIFNRNKPLFDN
ncbi:hypothetical protein CEE45_12310 [Candidatus Heimdallarchaeota archaeon B3_Heim]|nr:MAG: hypothetical protein CEE45_12310 [Candidatus Heimdallarchaeota archaeon B3_Heim]